MSRSSRSVRLKHFILRCEIIMDKDIIMIVNRGVRLQTRQGVTPV
jgi:hypothetical protein